MPIRPNLIERLAFFNLNLAPAPMLDFLGAMAFRAASAAVKLGVFEVLGDGPQTAAQVARRIEADERGVALLLDALEALGYVSARKGRYEATVMTTRWLPVLADGIPFFERVVFERWRALEERVRGVPPPENPYAEYDEQTWRDFEAGMMAVAGMAADNVTAKLKLPPTARRLIDIGGGHGLYSIKLCRRFPQLSATVFDVAEALEVAREVIAAEDMEGRVSVQEGNFWVDGLGTGFDVALLFNIVHAHQPDKNTELLRKVKSALNPGGLIVILDQLPGKTLGPAAKASAVLQGLNLFITAGGQAYSFNEISRWLVTAGFTKPRRINLLKSPGSSLVLANTTV